MNKNFGAFPSTRKFNVPNPTRGGNAGAFERKQENPLTGFVKDRRAAQGEERLARSAYKGISKGRLLDFYFRWTLGLIPGFAGSRELDFFFFGYGRDIAVAVDGKGFVHRGIEAQHRDNEGDMLFLVRLKKLGYDVPEIIHVAAEDLETQEQADKVARKLNIL